MKWPFYPADESEEQQVPLNDTIPANERTRLTSAAAASNNNPRTAPQPPSSVTVQVEVPLDEDFLLDIGPDATYGSAVSRVKTQEEEVEASEPFTLLLRHDSEFSVGSAYQKQNTVGTRTGAAAMMEQEPTTIVADDLPPPLSVWQGALLLTADCLGTGLLALPGDVKVLGYFVGLGFLILNGPINFYAGTILAGAATTVERRQRAANRVFETALKQVQAQQLQTPQQQAQNQSSAASKYPPNTPHNTLNATSTLQNNLFSTNADTSKSITSVITIESALLPSKNNTTNSTSTASQHPRISVAHSHLHHDTATFDFIGMTQALFKKPAWTRFIMALYYTNIFLVLGNYILVMSHAVVATLGEGVVCIPVAGLIAVAGMFVVSQSRTMARLGRTASICSLVALLIVVIQCLIAADRVQQEEAEEVGTLLPDEEGRTRILSTDSPLNDGGTWRYLMQTEPSDSSSGPTFHDVFRQLSALGSIGFAMGSQKLFLNIRHELADRRKAPQTLAISLSIYTTVYASICIMAGPNPPAFLFDAIQGFWNRRVAGFLLWAHVIVSYAINSQAICSSMDRLFWHKAFDNPQWHNRPALRWMLLTAILAVTAYTVANAIPFFQDLVALIGAVTSVPLTLLMPAVYWRKQLQLPIWMPSWKMEDVPSYALLVFSVVFMVTATIGVLHSISQDWKNHGGRPFACEM